MGIYRNPYEDFPARVEMLWNRLEFTNETADLDLSVTAMLMVAMAGLASPWEFFKDNNTGQSPVKHKHPAFDGISDAQYSAAFHRVLAAVDRPLNESSLFGVGTMEFWRFGHVEEISEVRPLAEHLWMSRKKIPAGGRVELPIKNAKHVVGTLRNALSHGNICAFDGPSNNIDRLVFFCEDRVRDKKTKESTINGYRVVTATVIGFKDFLKAWFELIREPGGIQAACAMFDNGNELLAA